MNDTVNRIKKCIINLAKMSSPNRDIDKEIASIYGWTVVETPLPNPKGGEFETRSDWHDPSGQNLKVPHYTNNLDSAMELIRTISPDASGGFSWEPTSASAKFGAESPVQARTPAIAVCMQALLLRLRQIQNPGQ